MIVEYVMDMSLKTGKGLADNELFAIIDTNAASPVYNDGIGNQVALKCDETVTDIQPDTDGELRLSWEL